MFSCVPGRAASEPWWQASPSNAPARGGVKGGCCVAYLQGCLLQVACLQGDASLSPQDPPVRHLVSFNQPLKSALFPRRSKIKNQTVYEKKKVCHGIRTKESTSACRLVSTFLPHNTPHFCHRVARKLKARKRKKKKKEIGKGPIRTGQHKQHSQCWSTQWGDHFLDTVRAKAGSEGAL